jgi:nitroreductase
MDDFRDVLEFMGTRRSVKAAEMLSPGPDADDLREILTLAARVPDHGKVVPFYFVVFEGDARAKIGDAVADAFMKNDPAAPAQIVEQERARFMRAPVVVAVVYRARRGKHPLWEQMMSVGAACQNLLLAAHAKGYVGQWLSEWYAYDEDVRAAMGLDARDVIGGFIHLGSPPAEAPADRDRPEIDKIVTYWEPDAVLNKGDDYDREKFPFPRMGFALEKLGKD